MSDPSQPNKSFEVQTWRAEREFMENLVNTRLTTLLVVVGLLANAIVTKDADRMLVAWISWVAVVVVAALSVTVVRAHLRLREILRSITSGAPDDPLSVGYRGYEKNWAASARPAVTRSERVFRVIASKSANNIVGLYLPALLTAGTVAAALYASLSACSCAP